jgi:transcriptional regulator with XRE-family HTH domain
MRNNMTQEQLAAQCGLSRRTIGDVEAARSTPRFGAMLKICEALDLNVTIDYQKHASTHTQASAAPIDLDELLGDA